MSDLRDRYQPATPVHAASADQDQVAGRAAARSPFGVDMRALVGRRLLDVRALPPCLRILVLTGVGAVVFVAALLAFRDALGPGVALAQGQRIAAPIAVAVFGLALLGWSCALTGALHSTWAVALLALVVFTLVNAAYFLLVDWDALPLAARLITAAPLLPLALLWLWGLFVQLLRAGALPRLAPPGEARAWTGATFGVVLGLQALFYGPTVAGDALIARAPATIASLVVADALADALVRYGRAAREGQGVSG